MKAVCERDVLNDALHFIASRARNKVIPVLSNVSLTTGQNSLVLAATDMDSRSEISCSSEVSARGATTAPAERLAHLIDGLPAGSQVTLALDGAHLKVESGRSRYRLPILPIEDFPESPVVNATIEFTLGFLDVKRLFADTTSAIDINGRRYLEGALLYQSKPREIAVVATNGHRLIRHVLPADIQFAGRFIIPKPAVVEIVKLASEGELQFRCSQERIEVLAGRRTFSSTLIDATYPEIDQLIPARSGQFILVDRTEFLAAFRRLRGLADEYSGIDIAWSEGAPTIEMQIAGKGSGIENVGCECGLPDGRITFGPDILGPMLDVLKGDVIELHITAPDRVVRLVDPADEGLTVLAFPRQPRSIVPSNDLPIT